MWELYRYKQFFFKNRDSCQGLVQNSSPAVSSPRTRRRRSPESVPTKRRDQKMGWLGEMEGISPSVQAIL